MPVLLRCLMELMELMVIHTACVFDSEKPSGRLIAVTRSKPRNWQYEWRSLFAPSQALVNGFRQGYVSQPEFEHRYRVEMRHLYRTTTFLQELATQSQQEDIVLCGYEQEGTFCHRYLLKDILERIASHQSDGNTSHPQENQGYSERQADSETSASEQESASVKQPRPMSQTGTKCDDSRKASTKPMKLSQMSASELVQLQTRKRMPLPDRQDRIVFLEQRFGKVLRGKTIRFMTNQQLYALSQQAGYRRR